MSSMPQSAIRRVPWWHPWVFAVSLIGGLLWIGLTVASSFLSYGYELGTRTTVTVEDPCVDGGPSRRSDDDDCRGTWTAGGTEVRGTAHLSGEAVDSPARPYRATAWVLGDDARFRAGPVEHLSGLAAPWLTLLSALVFAVMWKISHRMERRRKAAWRAWKAERDARRERPGPGPVH